jgi:Transposase, Mutator family
MAEAVSIDGIGDLLQGVFAREDGPRILLQALARAAMRSEVEAHVGAAPHERSQSRVGRRNGTKPRKPRKPRTLGTRVGELELDVPQVRGCEPYRPGLFNKWQRSERALLVACSEMYFQGVSTRNVRDVLEAMCGGDVSAMTVSRVAQELDEKLSAFRSRRLDHTSWAYLMLDAGYEKASGSGDRPRAVRVDGRVVSQAVLVAVGFTAEGGREVLDWRVCDGESEQAWGECFRSLKDRGLKGVGGAGRLRRPPRDPRRRAAALPGLGVAAVPGAPQARAGQQGELQAAGGVDEGSGGRVRAVGAARVPAAGRGGRGQVAQGLPRGGGRPAGGSGGLPGGAVVPGAPPPQAGQHQPASTNLPAPTCWSA